MQFFKAFKSHDFTFTCGWVLTSYRNLAALGTIKKWSPKSGSSVPALNCPMYLALSCKMYESKHSQINAYVTQINIAQVVTILLVKEWLVEHAWLVIAEQYCFDVTTSNSIQDGGALVVNILVFDLRVQLQHCAYERKTLLFALIKVITFICKRKILGCSSPVTNNVVHYCFNNVVERTMLFIIVSTMLLNEQLFSLLFQQCCWTNNCFHYSFNNVVERTMLFVIVSTMLLNEQCFSLLFQSTMLLNEQLLSLLFQQCCWTNKCFSLLLGLPVVARV